MRVDLELGGKHQGAYDDGVIDIVYDGEVDESAARKLMAAGASYSTGMHTVWVSDVTRLTGFSAGARKVMSSGGAIPSGQEQHTYLFVAGATIKTKAVLSLVLTATRLLGPLRYHTVYTDTLEEARSKAHAKIQELVDAGLAKLPDVR
jgi:hypothetical protein